MQFLGNEEYSNTRIFARRKSEYSNSGSQCQLSPLFYRHDFSTMRSVALLGRFSSHVTETRTWVIHVKWMKGTHVAMLCLVTRNKQKHEAKGPNLVKDEATRA